MNWILKGLVFLTMGTSVSIKSKALQPDSTSKDSKLFELVGSDNKKLSTSYLHRLKDSLITVHPFPEELYDEIVLYLSVEPKEEKDVADLIDSLFLFERLKENLILRINRLSNLIKEEKELSSRKIPVYNFPQDISCLPGNCFYNSWVVNKVHPYPSALALKDSMLSLVLVNEDFGCSYYPPVIGPITSVFGPRDGRLHKGIDLDLNIGDPVRAAFSGKVRFAKVSSGYGRLVIIRHDNGLETFYAHLHRIRVKPGQVVESGDLIGLGGNSGKSTGSHLHFECRFKGIPLDPKHIINFKENILIGDTLLLKKCRNSYVVYPYHQKFHKVKRREYLYKIANRYGISVDELCKLNSINRKDKIREGDLLRIW